MVLGCTVLYGDRWSGTIVFEGQRKLIGFLDNEETTMRGDREDLFGEYSRCSDLGDGEVISQRSNVHLLVRLHFCSGCIFVSLHLPC
jgi:hypothetical protein